jgi:hypothetical protein
MLGRTFKRVAKRFLGAGRPADGSRLSRPNTPEEWEQAYLTEIEPVTGLSHPVARFIAEATSPGDVLLEAGCGSAALSAELATAGRTIELADFSPKILDRAAELFRASGLPAPRRTVCDLTRPLPWPDRSVDVVWSSGVLEHWTDEELVPILGEMARMAKTRVISFVPYAGCVLYRLAKHLAESRGRWPYGRELPRQTLRPLFDEVGLRHVREQTLWSEAAPRLLWLGGGEQLQVVRQWWDSLPEDDPVRERQGYLLVTVGDVP